jgi:hypothetical protein
VKGVVRVAVCTWFMGSVVVVKFFLVVMLWSYCSHKYI